MRANREYRRVQRAHLVTGEMKWYPQFRELPDGEWQDFIIAHGIFHGISYSYTQESEAEKFIERQRKTIYPWTNGTE